MGALFGRTRVAQSYANYNSAKEPLADDVHHCFQDRLDYTDPGVTLRVYPRSTRKYRLGANARCGVRQENLHDARTASGRSSLRRRQGSLSISAWRVNRNSDFDFGTASRGACASLAQCRFAIPALPLQIDRERQVILHGLGPVPTTCVPDALGHSPDHAQEGSFEIISRSDLECACDSSAPSEQKRALGGDTPVRPHGRAIPCTTAGPVTGQYSGAVIGPDDALYCIPAYAAKVVRAAPEVPLVPHRDLREMHKSIFAHLAKENGGSRPTHQMVSTELKKRVHERLIDRYLERSLNGVSNSGALSKEVCVGKALGLFESSMIALHKRRVLLTFIFVAGTADWEHGLCEHEYRGWCALSWGVEVS